MQNTNNLPEPITRDEKYMAKAAGAYDKELPEPITRMEQYEYAIATGGGGGGGTSDYSALSNKPQINNVTLSGNKSSSDLGLQSSTLGSWTAGTATSHSTPAGTDTVLEALEKIDNNQRLDETNISLLQSNKIGTSDYASQSTGGTVRIWTTTSGTDTILHIANEAPTP